MQTRSQALAVAKRFGKQAHAATRTFARQVVTLAFVRDRIDRGFGDERVQAAFNDETQWLRAARVDADRPWRRWRWRNSGRVPCAETRATSRPSQGRRRTTQNHRHAGPRSVNSAVRPQFEFGFRARTI